MNFGFTRGVDLDSIAKTITKKLDNLPKYRAHIKNMPLWLLYYSEGYPASAYLTGPNYNERVLQHIRTLARDHPNSFDEIWWADNIYSVNGPRVFKVT